MGPVAELTDGVTVVSRKATLQLAVQLSMQVAGNIIEFGVADGTSTRIIRNELLRHQVGKLSGQTKRIYACDSFEGLPQKFENAEVGAFAGPIPRIPGVQIVKGYFDDSLTPELAETVGPVALASLDADLYSSTTTALRWLTPLLKTGSLLLFDEYLGENESEKRAHDEWSHDSGIETVMVATFRREPSGWGEYPDQRVLRQVVGVGEPSVSKILTLQSAVRQGIDVGRKVKRSMER
ncbi:MAG: TylF/MycF/NovP-related O-methyltransferase, partial [Nitrososphaerales archaeon]